MRISNIKDATYMRINILLKQLNKKSNSKLETSSKLETNEFNNQNKSNKKSNYNSCSNKPNEIEIELNSVSKIYLI